MATKGWCCGVVLLLACAACGGGGGADVDAAPPDAGPCNTVASLGEVVDAVRVAEEAPARNGGTLVDGTYVVTSYRGYTGVGGSTVAPGIQIEATSVNEAGHYDYVDSGNASAGSYATGGNEINILQTCPTEMILTFTEYNASPTGFSIYDVNNPDEIVELTFTLQ